jgi:hypothetical protein
LQEHEEGYHDEEREHPGVQTILREVLTASRNPLLHRFIRVPPTDDRTEQEPSGRGDIEEAGRKGGGETKSRAQNVSRSGKKRVLCPAEKAATQMLRYELSQKPWREGRIRGLTVKETFGYSICLNVGSGLNCNTASQPFRLNASPGLSNLLAGI